MNAPFRGCVCSARSRRSVPLDDWHIGARYTSPNHQKGWVVSLSGGTAVPQPASGLLFGTGLMIVGAAARKRLD